MTTDNNPCPITHKHVIALSAAILLQLAYIISHAHILQPVMLFAGIGAMLYWIAAYAHYAVFRN